ncbi:MAG: histidine kinase [Flavobacteriales bacterium]|nr:histidine kinase [Flavobacteriales bacterium]
MRCFVYIVTVCCCLCGALHASAQITSRVPFRHYDTQQGLPSTQVQGIFEDSRGYIWTITDRGAARYDGYTFRTYTTKHGFSSNNILLINEDHHGRMWFMCNNGEYCYLDGDTIRPYAGNSKIKNLLRDKLPGPFYFDEQDTLWITTFSGIQLFKCFGDSVSEFKPAVSGSQTPTYYLRRVGEKLITLQVGEITHDNKISTTDNISYLLDVAGECKLACSVQVAENRWAVAGPGGFVVFDEAGNLKAYFESSPYIFSTLEHDRSGNLWLTNSNGAFRLKNYNNGPGDADVFFEGHFITSVLQDHLGNYWFGDRDNGLFFVPSLDIEVFSTGTSGKQDKIISVKEHKGKLYYSDASGQIYLVQEKRAIKLTENPVPSGVSLDFTSTQNDKFITGNKPFLLDPKKGTYKLLDDQAVIRKSLLLHHGDCVFGLSDGIAFLDVNEKWQRVEKTQFGERCNSLFEDTAGILWIGTNTGLYKYDGTAFQAIDPVNEKKPRVADICEWNGYLVCCTRASGLIFYKDGKTFSIKETDGLLSDMTDCVVTDGNSLWVGTASGIQHIIVRDLEKTEIATFVINDQKGLPSNEVNDILYYEGKLLVATNDGYCVIDPESEALRGRTTQTFITDLMVNGIVQSAHDSVFHWNENNIRIHFQSLYFRTAEKTTYRYKLLGFFDYWIETNMPSADFPVLPAGRYDFIVQARNEDGIWGEGASTTFIILPHYSQTWWFRTVLAMILIISIYLIFYFVYQNKKAKLVNRAKMSELRQQALNANMNPHFIFNALGSIQHFINGGKSIEANEYLADFSRLIRMNLETNQESLVSLDEELERLSLYLKLEHLRFTDKLEYEIIKKDNLNTFDLEIPPMLLQPYVENALLHGILPSGRPGKLTISIYAKDSDYYCIDITDNGIGLTASIKTVPEGHKSLALKMNQERLAILEAQTGLRHRAEITDLSMAGNSESGTRVSIILPV